VLHPQSIAIGPDGESAYVTSENDGQVSQYIINPTTGKIAPMSPATVATTRGAFGVAVTPYAKLSTTARAPATVNHRSTLTDTVSNAGPSNAWQLVLTDHLPSGTRLMKASTTNGHCAGPQAGTSGATVRCHLGTLDVGAVWRIQIRVTATGHRAIRGKVKLTSVTPHT
jgi:uncharacterized repeat protein (TIGR01451 family)